MRRWMLYTAPLAALFALAACTDPGPTDPGPFPARRDFSFQEMQVAGANTVFAFELLRRVHPEADAPNLLLSPLSASMALGMAMNGTTGDTYAAMRATLGFGTLREEQVNAAYRGLIEQLRVRDRKVEFRLANSVWARSGFAFEATFLDATREHFDAHVAELDFAEPHAPAVINAWADEATGGRISEIVEQIDPLDIMFLLNAVYFKAPWSSPFEPQATRAEPFQRLGGGTVQAPTMMRDGATAWFQDQEVSVAELPYADSAFVMTLIQPADGQTLDGLIGSLTPELWQGWLSSLQSSRVLLYLPKFRYDFDTSLLEPLDAMGMGIAFDPASADFSRLTRVRDDVYISGVRQKTYIDVHELGTEAAAVTSVTVSVTSMPPILRFDRPFLYAIRERESGAILFIGRVGDPTAG